MTVTTADYADVVMGTYGVPKRVLVRGSGCQVWDADGRDYLDFLAGIAVNALGHAHPALVAALTPAFGQTSDDGCHRARYTAALAVTAASHSSLSML